MILNIFFFCLLSLPIALVLTISYLYQIIVKILLKIQLKDKFLALLDGTDCVWAIEDTSSLSVINVLAVLEEDPERNVCRNLLHELRALIEDRLLTRDGKNFEKFVSLRKRKYGYYYWQKCDRVCIEEHVRWLEDEDSSEEDLWEAISKICNEPLPLEHEACWEILVGRSIVGSDSEDLRQMEEGTFFCDGKKLKVRVRRIPILFRVHHTLGDGVALLRLLLEDIADKKNLKILMKDDDHDDAADAGFMNIDDKRKHFTPHIHSEMEVKTKYVTPKETSIRKEETTIFGLYENSKIEKQDAEEMISRNKELLSASMPFSPIYTIQLVKWFLQKYAVMRIKIFLHTSSDEIMRCFRTFFWTEIRSFQTFLTTTVYGEFRRIAGIISILIVAPGCLIQQSLRSRDNSALHGPKLSGKKIIACWMERRSKSFDNVSLVTKIQDVKNATGTKFSDVVMAALSSSLLKHFKQINDKPPKTLTVVVPARMTTSRSNFHLENGFSVGLLPLCIHGTKESGNELTIIERLFNVAANSKKLRKDPDYMVNFWVMKWLSDILPEVLLRLVLKSHSTLVFSNVPGPEEVDVLGRTVENIVFWVPQKGTTGIGCSVLSYDGRLHFGLVADRAIFPNSTMLQTILEDTVHGIENLHNKIFPSPFSKTLHDEKSALRKREMESCKLDEQ